jgi:hypothetical protein
MTKYLRKTTLKEKRLIWLIVSKVSIKGKLVPLFLDLW